MFLCQHHAADTPIRTRSPQVTSHNHIDLEEFTQGSSLDIPARCTGQRERTSDTKKQTKPFDWTSALLSADECPRRFLSVFFLQLPLFRYNWKARDGCNYASSRPTLTNMLGHLRTSCYSSVKKCPFLLPFYFTSKICVFTEAFSDKKTLKSRCLSIFWNIVCYQKICVLLYFKHCIKRIRQCSTRSRFYIHHLLKKKQTSPENKTSNC